MLIQLYNEELDLEKKNTLKSCHLFNKYTLVYTYIYSLYLRVNLKISNLFW